jgi:hypothetical protein
MKAMRSSGHDVVCQVEQSFIRCMHRYVFVFPRMNMRGCGTRMSARMIYCHVRCDVDQEEVVCLAEAEVESIVFAGLPQSAIAS